MSDSTYIEDDGREHNEPSQQEEEKQFDFIPEDRLRELLNILLPWGYSHQRSTKYTGLSPYIGDGTNIITIWANDPDLFAPFSICMNRFDEDGNEDDALGFYKGIMKVIAPELHSNDDKFKGDWNVLDFDWADDYVQENKFPVDVTYKPTDL